METFGRFLRGISTSHLELMNLSTNVANKERLFSDKPKSTTIKCVNFLPSEGPTDFTSSNDKGKYFSYANDISATLTADFSVILFISDLI